MAKKWCPIKDVPCTANECMLWAKTPVMVESLHKDGAVAELRETCTFLSGATIGPNHEEAEL